jgi:ABC-2 type transport system permease protein
VLLVGTLALVTGVALALEVRSGASWLGDYALWVAVVFAYALFWLLLAAFVNLRGRSSAENAMTLATGWLVLTILLPAALNITATLRYPVPSRAEMVGVEREAAQEAQQQGATLLAAFYQDHPELAPDSVNAGPVNFAAQSWAVQEEVERIVGPVRARYDEQAEQQRTLLRRFRFLSPALIAQEALQDIAGTGDMRYREFRARVQSLRAEFRAFIGSRIVRSAPFTRADVADIPALDAAAARGIDDDARTRIGVNLLALLALCAVATMAIRWQLPHAREHARMQAG